MNQNPHTPTTPEQRGAQARAVALETKGSFYRSTYQQDQQQRRRSARALLLWTALALAVLVSVLVLTGNTQTTRTPNNYHVHKLSPDSFLVSCQTGDAAAEHVMLAGSNQLVVTCRH